METQSTMRHSNRGRASRDRAVKSVLVVRQRMIVAICAVVTLLSSGCQKTGVTDKAGNNVLQLHFVTVDDLNSNGQTPGPGVFVQALEKLSGGRITVTVASSYEDGAFSAESDIVSGIARDKFDGGWPDTRAFARAGIRGLEAVEAPMTLTSYAAEKALVTGPAGAGLLKTLKGTGILGLGLTEGPLRRVFSTAADLNTLQSWHGLTVRTFNSPVQEATIRALGAVPVSASYHFPDLVEAGKLKAAETDVAQYALNDYGTLLPHVLANVVLWPRIPVLAFSQQRFDSLTRTEQRWVREAAAQAVQASVAYHYNENGPAATLCQQGVRFLYATPAQLRALNTAVQPVLTELSHDPASAPGLSLVQAVANAHPTPDTVDVPSTCRGG
jgi:TRAP-type C4-dicarboxylate transport system substrate-binding protein